MCVLVSVCCKRATFVWRQTYQPKCFTTSHKYIQEMISDLRRGYNSANKEIVYV